MTVEQTLRNALILYPSLYDNAFNVYEHWFITNGNGMYWENGELIDFSNSKPLTIEEAINKHFEFHLSEKHLLDSPLKHSIKRCKENIIQTLNWEKSKTIFKGDPTKIYPLCEYACIFEIPNNIKPDWLCAVKMMYEWLIENYSQLSDNNKKYVDLITEKYSEILT